MTLPTGRGNGAPPGVVDDTDGDLAYGTGGVGALEGTAEDGRDHPLVLLGWGVAVNFAVTRRG